ncbi:hypothetical protein L1049_000710 [Liquidambar formosana]|uniref:Uncharacterized protein n=1 Tax=Liquidambar formosana TaxID=63359 RepID=A0AAP0NCV2_LIQFO
MALPEFPLPVHFIILSIIFFTIAAQAQVPANKTFKFINQGEFGDRIIEYDASYRVIRNEVYTFYTFPFRLCFYNTTPDAHIFAIRAGIPSDESLMRWVWDANRNHPVRENATLTFGWDGNFALADVDGRVQSFDYPTDTLLVGQSVKINGRNKLIGRTSEIDGSDGAYSIVLEDKGFNMYIKNSGKNLIYGGWGGSNLGSTVTFDAVPENDNATAYELVLVTNQHNAPHAPPPGRRLLQVRPIGVGGQLNLNKLNYNATYSLLRLGYDGNLKAYTYYDKCGAYGLCDRRMCVACPSPKGLLGWSESCAPPKVAACKGGAKVDYYKIVGVEHFLSPYLDGGCFYKEDSSKCLLAPLLGTLIKDVNTSVGYIYKVLKVEMFVGG